MKGDRASVGILRDEEATEGAIGKGGEDGAAPLDERVVQHAGVVAGDPEHHAHAEWPGTYSAVPYTLFGRKTETKAA